MIADGRCPCGTTAGALWGRKDASGCQPAVPAFILRRLTSDASCESYIPLGIECVYAA